MKGEQQDEGTVRLLKGFLGKKYDEKVEYRLVGFNLGLRRCRNDGWKDFGEIEIRPDERLTVIGRRRHART